LRTGLIIELATLSEPMTLGVKRTEGVGLATVSVGVTSLAPESEGDEMMVVASVVDDKSDVSETADSVSGSVLW
jgi:hypothetical protein